MATSLQLKTINVFQTEAQYEANKSSLGEDELSLVPFELSGGNPVGTVIAFAANSAPDGYLLCNGSAVSRTTYADLYAKIGTTYGSGNGSTTFNLPNLTDKFIQGSGTAGTSMSAGLPNITGNISAHDGRKGNQSKGAFALVSNQGRGDRDTGTADIGNILYYSFDASRSSSIYGASTTVQPPALTMRMYIKY